MPATGLSCLPDALWMMMQHPTSSYAALHCMLLCLDHHHSPLHLYGYPTGLNPSSQAWSVPSLTTLTALQLIHLREQLFARTLPHSRRPSTSSHTFVTGFSLRSPSGPSSPSLSHPTSSTFSTSLIFRSCSETARHWLSKPTARPPATLHLYTSTRPCLPLFRTLHSCLIQQSALPCHPPFLASPSAGPRCHTDSRTTRPRSTPNSAASLASQLVLESFTATTYCTATRLASHIDWCAYSTRNMRNKTWR